MRISGTGFVDLYNVPWDTYLSLVDNTQNPGHHFVNQVRRPQWINEVWAEANRPTDAPQIQG
jgi:hypothetical protein